MDRAVLAKKKLDLLEKQIKMCNVLENYNNLIARDSTSKQMIKNQLTKIVQKEDYMNSELNSDELLNQLNQKWNRIRKTLLQDWIKFSIEEQKVLKPREIVNEEEMKDKYKLDFLDSNVVKNEEEFEYQNVKDYQYRLLPTIFKKVSTVYLTREEFEANDEVEILTRVQNGEGTLADRIFSVSQQDLTIRAPNYAYEAIPLSDPQKEQLLLLLLSKEQRRERNIDFINCHVTRLQDERISVKEFKDLLFKEESIANRNRFMVKNFAEMNVKGQIKLLLGQWLILESKILEIKYGNVEDMILQERFKQTFSPILGSSYAYYNLRSLMLEASTKIRFSRGAQNIKESPCIKSIKDFPVKKVIQDFSCENEEELNDYIEHCRENRIIDHLAQARIIVEEKPPHSQLVESIITGARRIRFNCTIQ